MIAAELRGGNKPNLSDALGWIGSRVDDIYGAAVGRLEDVWIDPGTGTPRWLLVKEGRFGGRTTLIPFEDATAGAGHVWIPYERDAIRAAPEIEPGAPLTQQVESQLRDHFRAHAPAAVSHRGHGEPPAAAGPAPAAAPAPAPLGGQRPVPGPEPSPRIASPSPVAGPAPAPGLEPTPYRPAHRDVPPPTHEPTPEPYREPPAEPAGQPIPFARPAAPQPPPGPPPLRSADPPSPPEAPGSSWVDPAARPVLRPAPAPPAGEPSAPSGSAAAPPAAIHRAPPPEPDATALPVVHRLDRPYRIELELEGGLRISGELRSLRILPIDES